MKHAVTHRPKHITVTWLKSRNHFATHGYAGSRRVRVSLATEDRADALDKAQRLLGHLPEHNNRDHRRKALADPDIYIYQRMPYEVKIGKRHLGFASSRAEARRIRNEYLGIE